ncbi:uncharacterized protein [Musca autumnalis]|uniref:uncharacterized protein n=1 Tax=Musca autumnalis TaxID=221902 RepID=UPI003CF43BCE
MKLKKLLPLSLLVIVVLFLNDCSSKQIRKRGVMDNFNDGLKFAGQMFGINTAADVANLVAKAFSKTASKGNSDLLSSLVQKGLQSRPSKPTTTTSSSSSDEYTNKENSKKHDSEESGRNQQYHSNDRNEEGKKSSTPGSKEKTDLDLNTTKFVTSILRMVGFDATKLGALALNVLIMVASTIATTLLGNNNNAAAAATPSRRYPSHEHDHDNAETGPEERYSPTEHQPRMLTDGTPLDWFLQNPSKKMKSMLSEAIDSGLTDKITTMISNYETEEGQTDCVKMLMCKSAPFIWGMQKSLKKRINGGGEATDNDAEKEKKTSNKGDNAEENRKLFDVDSLYAHFPSLEEFREHGSKCEELYSNYCNITQLRRKYYQT